jgi:hypothetical protein
MAAPHAGAGMGGIPVMASHHRDSLWLNVGKAEKSFGYNSWLTAPRGQ